MAKHHVAAESAIRRHRPFEIHERSRCQTAEARHRCGLRTDLRRKGSRSRFRVDDGQADAVHRNALAGPQLGRDAARDAKTVAGVNSRDVRDFANRFNQSREHNLP